MNLSSIEISEITEKWWNIPHLAASEACCIWSMEIRLNDAINALTLLTHNSRARTTGGDRVLASRRGVWNDG